MVNITPTVACFTHSDFKTYISICINLYVKGVYMCMYVCEYNIYVNVCVCTYAYVCMKVSICVPLMFKMTLAPKDLHKCTILTHMLSFTHKC